MNCKPGDLAIIVRGEFGEDNIGRIVEIVQVAGLTDGRVLWHVNSLSPLKTLAGRMQTKATVEDDRLRPISGVPVTDDIEGEVVA